MTLTPVLSSTTIAALPAMCNQREWALRRFWFGNSSNVFGLRSKSWGFPGWRVDHLHPFDPRLSPRPIWQALRINTPQAYPWKPKQRGRWEAETALDPRVQKSQVQFPTFPVILKTRFRSRSTPTEPGSGIAQLVVRLTPATVAVNRERRTSPPRRPGAIILSQPREREYVFRLPTAPELCCRRQTFP